jgi:hypothetical protein
MLKLVGSGDSKRGQGLKATCTASQASPFALLFPSGITSAAISRELTFGFTRPATWKPRLSVAIKDVTSTSRSRSRCPGFKVDNASWLSDGLLIDIAVCEATKGCNLPIFGKMGWVRQQEGEKIIFMRCDVRVQIVPLGIKRTDPITCLLNGRHSGSFLLL